MFRIIYISIEERRFTEEDLQALLEQSREKNLRLGITGLLLYRQGNFMQVLEGGEVEVKDVFTSILNDPRHRRVIALVREPVEKRDFPKWSMAFLRLKREEEPPGFSDLLEGGWSEEKVLALSEAVRGYVRTFVAMTA